MRAALGLLLLPALAAGQAVPRTDTPRRGAVRISFEPRIEAWDFRFADGRREPLGAPLSGDTVGGAAIPALARLEQDVRQTTGAAAFTASLGKGLFRLRHEHRVTPLAIELGVTDHLAVGVTLPVVRTFTRVHFALDPAGASVGLNPLLDDLGAPAAYSGFFTQFDAALAQLDANIAGGSYGCPGSAQCQQAQALSAQGHALRDALHRSTYGPGTAGAAPFLPRAASDGGVAIDATVAALQQELATTYGVTGFTAAFLLPTDPITTAAFAQALADTALGFGLAPWTSTPRRLRVWPGDAELHAKYRLVSAPWYRAAATLVLRLPTGHLDSPHDALDVPAGDGQTDVEVQVAQELILARRLWLNVAVRAARQQPGRRERRVAPPDALLVPRGAAATLEWDPGDYLGLDAAPLVRLGGRVGAGVTVGYWTKARDRYRFLDAADSTALAARLGAPTSAALLEAGTAERRLRLGAAVTYVGPAIEGGLSFEQTVSGAGGAVPAGPVFRILLRVARPLF